MAFKFINREQKETKNLTNEALVSFLLENHKQILSTRSPSGKELSETSDDISIPNSEIKNKKEFDFFYDEGVESARQDVLADLEIGTIVNTPLTDDVVVVDRRKSRKK